MNKQTLVVIVGFGLGQINCPSSWCVAGETAGAAGKDNSASAANGPAPARSTLAPLKDLQLSFKLDPRLTKGLYMGDHWVSPPVYTRVGEGKECVVETRAFGLSSRGQTVHISARWTSADPDTVSISPAQGHEVKLSMIRAGETTVEIVAGEFSKKLTVKVVERSGSVQADIIQHPAARKTRGEAGHSAEPATKEGKI